MLDSFAPLSLISYLLSVIPPISAPALILAVVGVMALLAVMRGVLRLIRTMVALAIGFVAGTVIFLHAPEWFQGIAQDLSGKWTAVISLIGGAIGHLGSSFALNRVLGGIDTPQAAGQHIPKGRAILLSLLPSGLMIWIGGVVIRLAGSLSGMAHADHRDSPDWDWLARAQAALSRGAVGRFFNLTDPLTSPEHVRLCEILVAYRESGRWQTVRHDAGLEAVVRHPKFRRLLEDRDVRRAVAFSNYPRLLTLREVREAVHDSTLALALRSVPDPEVRRAERVP
jgi:hypothetical protein